MLFSIDRLALTHVQLGTGLALFLNFLQHMPIIEHTTKEENTVIENKYECTTTLKWQKNKNKLNCQTNSMSRKVLIIFLKLSSNASNVDEILLYWYWIADLFLTVDICCLYNEHRIDCCYKCWFPANVVVLLIFTYLFFLWFKYFLDFGVYIELFVYCVI